MTNKRKKFAVWRYGLDIRIYDLEAETPQQAQSLVEKYPYLPHKLMSDKEEIKTFMESATYRVVVIPETPEALLEALFGRKKTKKKGV